MVISSILKNSNVMTYITSIKGVLLGALAFYIDKLGYLNMRMFTTILLFLLVVEYWILFKVYSSHKEFEQIRKNIRSYVVFNLLAWYFATLIFFVNF